MKNIASVISYVLNEDLTKNIAVGLAPLKIQNDIEEIFKEHNTTSRTNFVIDGRRIKESVHISLGREIVHGVPK